MPDNSMFLDPTHRTLRDLSSILAAAHVAENSFGSRPPRILLQRPFRQ